MLRVVLDTNVLISALAFQGETRKVWELAQKKQFHPFTSAFILSELVRNLLRLGLGAEEAALLVEEVEEVAALVEPVLKLSVIAQDDDDNRILECAVAAQADVVVTGDLKHIRPLGCYEGIDILTPSEFLTKHF